MRSHPLSLRVAVTALVLLAAASPVLAAGPLIVNGDGVPFVFDTSAPVAYHPDRGKLGQLENAAAVAEIAANFATWSAVPTTAITFANDGALPVDVTAANIADYYGVCDGLSPVIFDVDGTLTDSVTGLANFVLGFATPECGNVDAGSLSESILVLNGRFLDGVDSPTNPEYTLAEFRGVILHELGHWMNLDHSQINVLEGLDGNPTNDAAVATMFPFNLGGTEQATLHFDDAVSISRLYPAPSFATAFGKITGSIFEYAPGVPFQGAYVVARKLDDPRNTAVGAASGDRFFPNGPGGGPPPPSLQAAYELPGLPPGDYSLEIEEVGQQFVSGSNVGPLDPPAELAGPPEFWNDANEAGAEPPDDPTEMTPITIAAGAVLDPIDIVINQPPAPPNDDCANATDFTTLLNPQDLFTYVELPFTHNATTEPGDPLQSCTEGGPDQNLASIWYTFTPPTNGAFSVSTFWNAMSPPMHEGYDPVVTMYSGTCGALTELDCMDQLGNGLEATGRLDVVAGQTYLAEVTNHHTTTPKRTSVTLRYVPDTPICDTPAGAVTDFKLLVSKLGAPLGDEKLTVDFQLLAVPSSSVIDALANGVQLWVDDVFGAWTPYYGLATVTAPATALPPGGPGTGCDPRDGWKASGQNTRFTYNNKSGALPAAGCTPGSANGISKVKVDDRRTTSGYVRASFRAKNVSLPIPVDPPPIDGNTMLRAVVSFGTAPGAPCAEISLHCEVRPNGRSMICDI